MFLSLTLCGENINLNIIFTGNAIKPKIKRRGRCCMKIERQSLANKINELKWLAEELSKHSSADSALQNNIQAQLLDELNVAVEDLLFAEKELQSASLQLESNYQQIEAQRVLYFELFNFAPDT
jgi:hypothetical protein